MIELRNGDILQADVEALVNTVNCVGVMGRGIALQFKKAFPKMFAQYKQACDSGAVRPGEVLTCDLNRVVLPRYVINFPTKRHWRGTSRLADIDAGLAALVAEVRRLGLRSLAVPPLGCGLGGLRWSDVRPRIEQAFAVLPDVKVVVFEPAGTPDSRTMVKSVQVPAMTPGRAALLVLMRQYLAAVMDPSVTLLEIHKLMYFMQQAGEPLRLRYAKGPYGPYAQNLRHVLTHIDGHFVDGYGDAEDRPDKEIAPRPDAVAAAEDFLAGFPEVRDRRDRVASLIAGFETPFGMELLATVHWVSAREGAGSSEDAYAKTQAWGTRKRMFNKRHVRVAWENLSAQGWLPT